MAVFAQKETVFFVGGRGTKAGDANAGGCTKAYWGDLDDPNKVLSDVMGTNGEPIVAAVNCTFSNTTKRVTTGGGAFQGAVVGLVAYVSGTNITTGLYEITDVDVSEMWVELLNIISIGDNADTTINMGGAFPGNDDIEFQAFLDETDATNYDVFILTNTDIEAQGYTLDVDTGGGSSANGSWKRIIGIDANGVELPAGSYVEFDVGANDITCFKENDVSCIEFRHIWAKKSSGASTKSGWELTGTGWQYGFSFIDCKSEGFREAFDFYVFPRTISILGGHFIGTGQVFYINGISGLYIQGAILESSNVGALIETADKTNVHVDGCVFIKAGSGRAIRTGGGGHLKVTNSVFYNAVNSIYLNAAGSTLIEYNNIYLVNSATDKAINRVTGSIAYSDYSCLWTIEGVPTGSDRWGGGGKPPNAIEENPDFVNATGGDFRPRNPNVLRGGLPDIDDDSSQMGAILQKYQFARRARGVNVGRLQIIR